MTTRSDPKNGATALMDKPKVQRELEEVIFPAVDTTPTAKDLERLMKLEIPTAPRPDGELNEKAQVHEPTPTISGETTVSRKRKLVLVLVTLILVFAAGVSLFFYLKDRPRPVPAPTSVDVAPSGAQPATGTLPNTAFKISPEKQQLIGVQYGTVENESLSKSLRAVGRAALDETRTVRINPKVEGWIENVFVDFTGKLVKKGQPLLTIYSPDLVQTQEEYLLALKSRKQLSESPFGEAVNFSESLVQSARRRLELWDVTAAQIKELEARGVPSRTMTLYAPESGFVITRNAFPKQRVVPETELYQLADLSNIWIVADIYEFEAADIKPGQAATVTFSSYPDRSFSGKITYIYPQLDDTTRTLKVRIELANKDFLLKPDMYADVILNIGYGNRLVVPQEAVMDSGSEQLVYVSLGNGYFEPRKVQVGAKVDNKYIVISGLNRGERVVTSGNFLVDSESKLQSAAGGMGMPGMDHDGSNPEGQQTPKSKSTGQETPGVDHSQHKTERKILFWFDPMHPQYKSDKPGIAPDCGMDLVPKYADQ